MSMFESDTVLQAFVDGLASSVAVVAAAEQGGWTIVACNEDFVQMAGGPTREASRPPFPLDGLLPRYARREFTRTLTQCIEDGQSREFEQAFDLRDGTKWWRLTLKPFVVPNGGVPDRRLLVTALDITQKIELQNALEQSTQRFRSVVAAAYDAIVTVDQHQRITMFNRAAEDLFGYDEEDALGQPIEMLLPENMKEAHSALVDHFSSSPVQSRQMDERNRVHGRHRDGRLMPVEIAISKIMVGGRLEFTAIVRDIADRIRLMDLLAQQASTDPLTGLANRRAFFDAGERRLKAARSDGSAFSALILDVDHFKAVNDEHGHDVGDEVLRVLGRVGAQTLRHRDLFGRYGGEEFVVAMPRTDIEQSLQTAERLRQLFAEADFEHDWQHEPIPFTVSIGVATLGPEDHGLEDLLRRADEALYLAKDRGRNQVVGAAMPSLTEGS